MMMMIVMRRRMMVMSIIRLLLLLMMMMMLTIRLMIMIIIVVMFVFLACFRSQTIRKNAVQLISGLDISKQIRLVCCHRHLFTQHHS